MRAMTRPLSLYVGLRYTGARSRNSFISVITLISAVGLMLGVAVLITVLSVMNGFERELESRILGMVTHVSVQRNEPIEDWQSLASRLHDHPQVLAAAPYVQLQGMLTHGGSVTGALVMGIDPVSEAKVSIIEDFLWEGALDSLQPGSYAMVLGYTLARQLGISVGDQLLLVLPEASVTPAGIVPRFRRFTLTGTFRTRAELDGMLAYVHVEDAARLARHPGLVQGVRLRLQDIFSAPRVSRDLEYKLGLNFDVRDWSRTHGSLFNAIRMEKSMMTLLLSFIVAVAAFNIVSSQVMLVTEKRGDIAVLRTLGASPGTVMRIFMVQGSFIGLCGTFAGILLGVLLSLNVSDVANWIERVLNASMFDAYFINYLPSELRLSDVASISLIAVSISFAATLYPSWRASRVDPAEALRHE